jgi:hypothetical protein
MAGSCRAGPARQWREEEVLVLVLVLERRRAAVG